MKKLKENYGEIMIIIGELLVGIILLIKPIGFTKTIIVSVGIILTVLGIMDIVRYFKNKPIDAAREKSLAKGLVFGLSGLFCVFNSDWFIATFPVLTVLYGVGFLITGLMKVQCAVDGLRLKVKYWYFAAINAVLSIVLAVIIINNPFTTVAILWQFTGIALIVASILDIISVVLETKNK